MMPDKFMDMPENDARKIPGARTFSGHVPENFPKIFLLCPESCLPCPTIFCALPEDVPENIWAVPRKFSNAPENSPDP